MLKRIYIDNYKCCSNFELEFERMNLILGSNGSGKTTIFEVLRDIRSLLMGEEVSTLFFADTRTRWQVSALQRFELELEGNGGTYKYELGIEHYDVKQLARISFERLYYEQKPLLRFEKGDAHLYRDNYSEGPTYPFDWTRSAVATLPARSDNTLLTWFKDRIKRLIIVSINPKSMLEVSRREESELSPGMENFTSWYRHIYQDQRKAIAITEALREILVGFQYFNIEETGSNERVLEVRYATENGRKSGLSYRLNELSDGERTLIALYTLLYAVREEDYTLCIDEPSNYIALTEIQPWLTTLYDFCGEGPLQAILISHHPELINYLAVESGIWFERSTHGPVRARRIEDTDTGLPISELVARGWIDE